MPDLIKYSEIFYSIQGEGKYTGRPTVWIRFFACNLTCGGFGQSDPTDPKTYKLPYKEFDVSTVDKIEDLPVWEYGCDSSYSWAKKFKHLCPEHTAIDIVEKLTSFEGFNGLTHICFTGGEPLLLENQKAIVEILRELMVQGHWYHNITFETNGTCFLTAALENTLEEYCTYPEQVLFSVSPKLFSVSGEKNEKAIVPKAVQSYMFRNDDHSPVDLQFKFVLGDKDEQWEELNRVLLKFLHLGPDVWIMPVGATKESQENISAKVADRALSQGYSIAARVHCNIWGNKIGT